MHDKQKKKTIPIGKFLSLSPSRFRVLTFKNEKKKFFLSFPLFHQLLNSKQYKQKNQWTYTLKEKNKKKRFREEFQNRDGER